MPVHLGLLLLCVLSSCGAHIGSRGLSSHRWSTSTSNGFDMSGQVMEDDQGQLFLEDVRIDLTDAALQAEDFDLSFLVFFDRDGNSVFDQTVDQPLYQSLPAEVQGRSLVLPAASFPRVPGTLMRVVYRAKGPDTEFSRYGTL